jgi:hypothetical protein
MKLKCPACGAPISATDINVQQMVAVCSHCDNAFKIESVFQPQQRKIKAPAQFQIINDDPYCLDMVFKWTWRTEPPMSMVAIVLLLVSSLAILGGMVAEGAPLAPVLLPLAMGVWMGYTLLTLLVNRTHYESDGETLNVYTEPLYYIRYGKKRVPIAEISQVTVERPAYAPFPEGKAGFYNVYVHTFDRDKIRIAAYVNFEHAHFIAQELKTHLQAVQRDQSRLTNERAHTSTHAIEADEYIEEKHLTL